MAKYSIVKIAHGAKEYKVYWNQAKHNHNASTAAGTFAVQKLAAHLHVQTTALEYRSGSFQSNQSSPPTGANTFEVA